MSRFEIEAHRLAHDIEWMRARGAAGKGQTPEHFWDPHAATELGNLIVARLGPRQRHEESV
jgi:hypothetical protein